MLGLNIKKKFLALAPGWAEEWISSDCSGGGVVLMLAHTARADIVQYVGALVSFVEPGLQRNDVFGVDAQVHNNDVTLLSQRLTSLSAELVL